MTKRVKQPFLWVLLLAFVFVSMMAPRLMGQTKHVPSLITERFDETQVTVLRGNTHPLARPEFDRGLVSPSMPIEHRFLVLRRSPEQEAALEKLLAEQQDPASPNYQKWLTPVEFGQRFGPSDQDVQTIVQWLQSRGLQVASVANGRAAIEFSGTAAQVQQAFHTEIHNYEVNGKMHWANSYDPSIPSALTTVVVGVAALHDFKPKPLSHVIRTPGRNANGSAVKPLFNYPIGCTVGGTGSSACQYQALGPADFGTIYNVSSLWTGGTTGLNQTIAVMGQATILNSDITDLWSKFQVQRTGDFSVYSLPQDPPQGYEAVGSFGDEGESDLDLEWAGAIAPGAPLEFVTSNNVIDSSFCTVDGFPSSQSLLVPITGAPANACALGTTLPLPQILSLSYGSCEAAFGTSGNVFVNNMWSQAAGEGIAVVVATGDTDSANCEFPSQGSSTAQPATTGLAVSGLASTPYNTAVGGTDFNDASNPATYWNSTNSVGTLESAKGYIPEMTYNDSCTNILWNGVVSSLTSNPEANCNLINLNVGTSSQPIPYAQFIAPFGAGGGMSNCTTGDGLDVTSCGGGYSKPSWQVAPGVPNDGKRDLPDVAMFSGDGITGTFYVACQFDSNGGTDISGNPIAASCNPAGNDFVGFGGTSGATQVFAGILALVNQHMATVKNNPNYRIGLANPVLYELAQQQSAASCNTSNPGSSCVFNDITVGTISAPCAKSSPDCVVSNSSDTIGILTCCDASTGYDLATGLGSVNVANLVNGWNGATGSSAADFWLSLGAGNGTVVIPIPGDSSSFTFTVTAVNNFSGTYTYSCSGLPTLTTCSFTPSTTDSEHTSVTVTVSTTAASMMVPASRPKRIDWWRAAGTMSLACVLCAAFPLLGLQWKSRRFTTAAALLVFAVVLMGVGGCGPGAGTGGGGGGGGGSGGTPAGFYTPTVSVVSGNVTHSLNFNLSVR